MPQYVVTVIESHRVQYIVDADSEDDAEQKAKHPDRDYSIALDEYWGIEKIESIEEDK